MTEKKTILVLATGGTIAGVADRAGDPGQYRPGVMDIGPLLETVPGLGECAVISGRQIACIGSEDMTGEVWLRLAEAAARGLADPGVNGIVVLHGTDTMEETAYFLQLVLDISKPLVITGAMRPANAVSADGPMNILNAVRLAAHPAAAGRGVLVTMNDSIHAAREVAKTDPRNLDAFQSPGAGPLGVMLDGRPYFTCASRPVPAGGPFSVAGLSALPGVAIIYGHAGQGRWAVDAALAADARGIVHAGVGNGRVHRDVLPALDEAVGRGVAVVCSTRVGRGFVDLDAELLGRGFIGAGDLNPQKARVLLQTALIGKPDAAGLREIFSRY